MPQPREGNVTLQSNITATLLAVHIITFGANKKRT